MLFFTIYYYLGHCLILPYDYFSYSVVLRHISYRSVHRYNFCFNEARVDGFGVN